MHSSFGLLVLATLAAARSCAKRDSSQVQAFEDKSDSNTKNSCDTDKNGKHIQISPTDTSGYIFQRSFSKFGDTRFGYFLLDYDRPIVLTNGDLEFPANRLLEYENAGNYKGLEYSNSTGWAKFMKRIQRGGHRGVLLGKGTISITCGKVNYAVADLDDLNNSTWTTYPAFISHGTSKPLHQLAKVFDGPIKIAIEEIEDSTLAFALPLVNAQFGMNLPDSTLDSCVATFKDFNDNGDENDFSFIGKKTTTSGKNTVKTNQVLASVTLPKPTDRMCDDNDISEIVADLNNGIADLKAALANGNITTLDQLAAQSQQLKDFTQREDVAACRKRILGSLKPTTSQVGFKKAAFCVQKAGTDAWLSDPCCNKALGQCCAPSDSSVTVNTYTADSNFISMCGKNSDQAASLLKDWDARFQAINNVDFDYSDTFASMRNFLTTCHDEIWGLPCQVDTDCSHTATKCDVSSKRCMVDYTKMNKNYLSCIAREIIAQDKVMMADPQFNKQIGSIEAAVNSLFGSNFSQFVSQDTFSADTSSIVTQSQSVQLCESWSGDLSPVTCPAGSTMRVTYANYGRAAKDLTNCLIMPDGRNIKNLIGQTGYQTYDQGACTYDVTARVAQLCTGQNSCTVSSNNLFLAKDPCVGTYKYLTVQYECWHEQISQVSTVKQVQTIIGGAPFNDCVGPNSDDGKSRMVTDTDINGNKIVRRLAGDQTKCLARTRYNYRWWEFTTPAQQSAETAFRPNFCGDCSNGYCNDITQYAYCAIPNITVSACNAQNGYLRPRAVVGRVDMDCVLPNINSAAACIDQPVNKFTADPLGYFALENRCVLNTDSASCIATAQKFNLDTKVVVVNANDNPAKKTGCSISGAYVSQDTCSAMNGVWWTPKFWRNGQNDTAATCTGTTNACSAPCYDNKGMRKVCESQTECQNSWECDDFELMNPNTLGNTCYRTKTIGSDGFALPCTVNERETSYGCARDDVDASGCAKLSGFQWIGRAATQNQCRNRIIGCQNDGYMSMSNFVFSNSDDDATKNVAGFTSCDKCGGSFAQQYTVYPGTWSPSAKKSYAWTPKSSAVVNQWVPAVQEQDVEAFVNKAIMNTLSSYYLNWQSAQLVNGFTPTQRLICGCTIPKGSGKSWLGSLKRTTRLNQYKMASGCFDGISTPLGSCTYSKGGKLVGANLCAIALQVKTEVDNGGSIVKAIINSVLSFLKNIKRDGVTGMISDSNSGKSAVIVGDSISYTITGGVSSNLNGEVFSVFIENIPSEVQSPVFDVAVSNGDGSYRFLNLNVKYANGQVTVVADYPITETAIFTPVVYDGALTADTTTRSGAGRLVRGIASNLVAVLV